MKKGYDGVRDHHGELLPELSASATKMKYEKLVNTPLPTFDKNYPGSPFFTELGYFMLRRTFFLSSEPSKHLVVKKSPQIEEACVPLGTQMV